MLQALKTFRNLILPATLNSYSVIFFFNNKLMACLMMLVTFFNFYAGLSGLLAVLLSVILANFMGFDKEQLKRGLFSFNALLTGIGMGTFFDPGLVFFSLLTLLTLLSLILSVTLSSWLNKYSLPVLSIPFVVSFWFILLPSSQFENLGLTQRNIYWMNEMYSVGGNSLLHFFQSVNSFPLTNLVDIYLRSLSSIFFQDNLLTGLMISVALLICSRITFSLSIIGFLSAYFFAQFTGSETASITYYNIGANYIMVAIALGGFFVIPSRYSYLWTILLVPLTSLVLLFFNKLLDFFHLPVFSLPFSFVVIFFLYFLRSRLKPCRFFLTPIQHYSPETNLYTFNNNKERNAQFIYFPLYLPFWGEWSVSQGHDGKLTHKGEWGKAFDFVLKDELSKTYKTNGLICEDYYCYNKPVLSPADGFVEEIIDGIDDNEIGKINTVNNWGNTIIIRHLTGLYTQMSHLKKDSFKVTKGDFIKRGDLLANCGNSGRSPEPHLHFQVQTSPLLGSKTIDYPFAYYYKRSKQNQEFCQFAKPNHDDIVSGVVDNFKLKNAFDLIPNKILSFSSINDKKISYTESWEVFTDAYNYKYLYCKETETTAYFVNDGQMFYFTGFYGDKKSLLYYFYLTAYKVFLGDSENNELTEGMPLDVIRNKKLRIWLHDFIAPFYNYMQVHYHIKTTPSSLVFDRSALVLQSKIIVSNLGKIKNDSMSTITLTNNAISEFTFSDAKTNIKAICINS